LAYWNQEYQRIRSPILRYGFSVVSVAIALGGSFAVRYYGLRYAELPVLTLGIAFTSWYAGVGPSVLAVLLSCVAFDYFFTEPVFSLTISGEDVAYYFIFVAWAVIIASFSAVRRRVENSLRQARDTGVNLLNLTHDSIFVRDMQNIITYWNRGAQEFYGWTAAEVVGKVATHQLLQTVFPAPLDEIHAELLRTGRWEGELVHIKADGTQAVVASRWSLQRDEQQRPQAILELNNDITELKREQASLHKKRAAELEAANKELESFAYSVSHDLRAPLRHMVGYSELLQRQASSLLDEKSQRFIQTILDSAKRMGNLIDDLLAFSRIGRAETRKTEVDLEQLVKEVVAEVRQDTRSREIAWKIGALPVCYGDRSMLRLAVVNLVSNAVKFTRMRSPAEIEIGCVDLDEKEVEMFVKDNGAGFEMQYVDKLFGVFQRLHSQEQFEGTGIGLATVQRIMLRHGGKVRGEGAVDQGATFYFSLPKTQDMPERTGGAP
jgi:PAS domain S-box-containing protein